MRGVGSLDKAVSVTAVSEQLGPRGRAHRREKAGKKTILLGKSKGKKERFLNKE
jgi:hypothetical protein